ncbi:hypothetical protein JCM12856_32020 [Spirochaeta dissipatitropha]
MFGSSRGGSVAIGALSGTCICSYFVFQFLKNNKKSLHIKTIIWFVFIVILGGIIGGAIAFIAIQLGIITILLCFKEKCIINRIFKIKRGELNVI